MGQNGLAIPAANMRAGRSQIPITSTPARVNLLSSGPAPMPTPAAHVAALSGLAEVSLSGAYGGKDDTQLLGLDFLAEQNNVLDYDDTVLLQQRAFGESSGMHGAGLGERLLEMLMDQGELRQQQQAVLQKMELGSSQIGRNRANTSRSSSTRRNEHVTLGPGGESFVDFELDVRFGDDLLVVEIEEDRPAGRTSMSGIFANKDYINSAGSSVKPSLSTASGKRMCRRSVLSLYSD